MRRTISIRLNDGANSSELVGYIDKQLSVLSDVAASDYDD